MFKKHLTLTVALACLAGATACKKAIETATGLSYEVRRTGTSDTLPAVGDIIEANFELYVKSKGKDTLLISSATMPNGNKMMVRSADSATFKGSFEEYLLKLHKGDSVTLMFSADSLFLKQFRMPQLPPYVDAGSKARLELGVAKIVTKAEIDKMMAKQQEEQMEQMRKLQEDTEKQKPIDDQKIKDFLAKNKITNFKKTDTGLYYVVKSAGKGAEVGNGDMVSVHYKGSLLENGEQFDASKPDNPLKYPAKLGQMIPGFDEGVANLKEGGKADLYLPSHLAYGGMGQGPIPAFSVLKFEVELIKVEKTQQEPVKQEPIKQEPISKDKGKQ
jgi:FKBP-type peptidyl-prolyl cis-trans isomerase FkpA